MRKLMLLVSAAAAAAAGTLAQLGPGAATELKAPGGGTIRALVVGVDVYWRLPAAVQLQGARADAEDIAGALSGDGVTPVVLFDRDATRAKIVAQMDSFVAQSRPGDFVLFAFAGHGLQTPEYPQWQGLDVDGANEQIALSGFNFSGDGADEIIVNPEMRAWLARLDAKGVDALVIMDSCFGGGMRAVDPRTGAMRTRVLRGTGEQIRAGAEERAKFVGIPMTEKEARANVALMPHVTFLAGATSKSVVPETDGLAESGPRGALSYFFARALGGKSARDGVSTRQALFGYLKHNVREATQDRQLIQVEPQSPEASVFGKPVLTFANASPPPGPSASVSASASAGPTPPPASAAPASGPAGANASPTPGPSTSASAGAGAAPPPASNAPASGPAGEAPPPAPSVPASASAGAGASPPPASNAPASGPAGEGASPPPEPSASASAGAGASPPPASNAPASGPAGEGASPPPEPSASASAEASTPLDPNTPVSGSAGALPPAADVAAADSVRVAIIDGPENAWDTIEKGKESFTRSSAVFGADLVWDVGKKEALSRGDLVMQFVDGSLMGGVIDRTWMLKRLRQIAENRYLSMQLASEGQLLTAGDVAKIEIDEIDARQLVVFNIAADATVQMLYPTAPGAPGHCADPRDNEWSCSLRVTPPFGADTIVALTTSRPADDLLGRLRDHHGRRDAAFIPDLLADAMKADASARIGFVGVYTNKRR